MMNDEILADVETTNWNAVKLLATQYGIQLRSLEEIKASMSTCKDPQEANDGTTEVIEDLGAGSPFEITAKSVDGGKIVYRFKLKGGEGGTAFPKSLAAYEDTIGASTSETGYDPGSDSPSSSWGKKAGQRKHPSTRTLKTKRSIPLLQLMSSVTQGKTGGSSASSSPIEKKKKASSRETQIPRQAAPQIQRGDVLGAILGLRDGITAQDYAWIDGRRTEVDMSKSPKSKGKGRTSDVMHSTTSVRPSRRGPAWRTITSFGEPVLQHRRAASIQRDSNSGRLKVVMQEEPSSEDEADDVFHDASLPVEDGSELAMQEDVIDETIIFDVLQHYHLKGKDQTQQKDIDSSPTPASKTRARQSSISSGNLYSPTVADDQLDDASSVKTTPGDDPRFALWAVRNGDENDTLILSSRDGIVDEIRSSPYQSVDAAVNSTPGTPTSSRRFSLRTPNSTNSSIDAIPSPGHLTSSQKSLSLPTQDQHTILLAASTSCLIAELTSQIDTQLLTDFFYTYRAYLSSQELLHLLILRLQWAMATPTEAKDEARRKIVRVRTYVVIKYWLSNFFEVDFVPDRALRTQLTDWLNAPHPDEAAGILNSLKKLVRRLKKGYEQGGVGAILLSDAMQQSPDPDVQPEKDGAVKSSDGGRLTLDWDGSNKSEDSGSLKGSSSTYLRKNTPVPGHHAPPPLPLSQNAISRAFVTTVGKLSRMKRNLNARSTAPSHATNGHDGESGLEGTELEANDGGDLLFVRGGLESFLSYFDLKAMTGEVKATPSEDDQSDCTTAQEQTPSLSTSSRQTSSTPASSIDLGSRSLAHGDQGSGARLSEDEQDVVRVTGAEHGLGISTEDTDGELANLTHANLVKKASVELLHHFQSDQTLRSGPIPQPPAMAPESPESKASRKMKAHHRQRSKSSSRGPDNIVQIDDIDSSSDEDDGMVRRALRRLPGARDLRMANNVHDLETVPRASLDSLSVSSFGRVYPPSNRSISSYYGKSGAMTARSSQNSAESKPWPAALAAPIALQKITTVQTEMLDPDEALAGYELVKGFQLDQLQSDDEEPGDVEAALRRLEGFIDQDKQKEKQRKVEAMWLKSRAKRDEDEEREAREDNDQRAISRQSAPSEVQREGQDQESSTKQSLIPAYPGRKDRTQTALPTSHDDRVSASEANGAAVKATPTTPLSRLRNPAAPVHRSFLLGHRSEVIAQQFCLIESELFKAVTWQELVSGQWKSRHYTAQVIDWESFYQSSVRRKAETNSKEELHSHVSNVEALIARFNLTCNWVASEVVLTRNVDDRAAVISKLIRIGWKCYHHCNFATLTQIILGLQSPWVERLSKTWSRVGMLELRMLRDLKAFINPARNFKHLRTATHDMIIQGGMMDLITSSGPPKGGTKTNQHNRLRLSDGCIPFFGLFLSDLTVNDALPTYIEPSSPNSAIKSDPSTGHLTTLAEPTAFDHLPPLPEQVPVTPLVNLYKYRNISVTVKSILAFQERLTSFEFEADANVYVKTLRLRCLEGEQLTQISHLVEP